MIWPVNTIPATLRPCPAVQSSTARLFRLDASSFLSEARSSILQDRVHASAIHWFFFPFLWLLIIMIPEGIGSVPRVTLSTTMYSYFILYCKKHRPLEVTVNFNFTFTIHIILYLHLAFFGDSGCCVRKVSFRKRAKDFLIFKRLLRFRTQCEEAISIAFNVIIAICAKLNAPLAPSSEHNEEAWLYLSLDLRP